MTKAESFELKIASEEYKDVSSALGGIYRACREGHFSVAKRDSLITFAKQVYLGETIKEQEIPQFAERIQRTTKVKKDDKLIKLKGSATSSIKHLWIRKSLIALVAATRNGSMIELVGGGRYSVQHTPEQILKKLKWS